MTGKTLTVNGVTYELKGDSDGVTIDGDKITGLNPNAQIKVSKAGTYNVNGTALDVKTTDTIVGVTSELAEILKEINSESTTEDILEEMGVADNKVETLAGDEDEKVTLPKNVGRNAAVIAEGSKGEKKVEMGNKGGSCRGYRCHCFNSRRLR